MSEEFTKQLKKLQNVSADPLWKERTKQVILASHQESPQVLSWQSFIMRPASVMALMGVLLFVGSVGVVNASKDALPGTVLYQVKLTSEKMKQQMTVSSDKRMELELAFVSNRLQELDALSEKDQISSDEVRVAIRQYSANIEALQEQLSQAKTTPSANVVAIASKVQKTKGEFESVLEKTAQRINIADDNEIAENVKRAQEKTVEIKKQALAVVVEEYNEVRSQQDQAKESLASLIGEELEDTQKRLDEMQEKMPEEQDPSLAVASVDEEDENDGQLTEESVQVQEVIEESTDEQEDPKETLDDLEIKLSEVKSILENDEGFDQDLPAVINKLEEAQKVIEELELNDGYAQVKPLEQSQNEEAENVIDENEEKQEVDEQKTEVQDSEKQDQVVETQL